MTQLRGIFAAMCTPFEDDGETVDPGLYRAHIDDMIEAGLHGLVLCSGTGEYAYLRDEERAFLIREGARHVDGRVPTIAQTTALSTADCIAKARAAEDCGVTAVMVMPPFLEPPGERGVLYHYEAIARAISIPVVMYNVPQQAAPLTVDLYRRLIAVENLDYVKDSSGDLPELQKLVACGGGVFNGADPYAPYALMAGCVGMIWGAANFMPQECARLYDLIAAGEHAEALALWDAMRDVCLWLWDNRHEVDYLSGVKAAARLSGRDMGPPRKPLPFVPGPARHDLRMALSRLPVNRSKAERLVWRDWQEERDWLVQSYRRA
ncbi:MAG: dihydrodipicolinate synthase family protein [Alphaproteobacteria bacterium]|nr:dihydrodipicolinate synthase family protein [Alphaproteobacteria bacterium]